MSFFSYYMGAPRIISLHTILGPPDHFLRLLYGAPPDQFLLIQYGSPSQISFMCLLYEAPPPPRSVSLHAIGGGGGTTDFSFFTKYMDGDPLRSVSPLTIWGPLRLVSLLKVPPLRSISSLTICGGPLR